MAEAPETRPAGDAAARPPAGPRPDRPDRPARPAPSAAEKPAEAKTVGDAIEWLFVWFIFAALILKALSAIISAGTGKGGPLAQSFEQTIAPYLHGFIVAFTIFATVLCLFLLIGSIYAIIRGNEIAELWRAKLYPAPPEEGAAEEQVKNPRWQLVVNHINSENSSDWRLAILESDIILADLFDSLGYQGDTVGDKLHSAERSPFRTLNAAWEAHKIRNAIAHEGQDFTLTSREARRVIGLYESVFREFDYI